MPLDTSMEAFGNAKSFKSATKNLRKMSSGAEDFTDALLRINEAMEETVDSLKGLDKQGKRNLKSLKESIREENKEIKQIREKSRSVKSVFDFEKRRSVGAARLLSQTKRATAAEKGFADVLYEVSDASRKTAGDNELVAKSLLKVAAASLRAKSSVGELSGALEEIDGSAIQQYRQIASVLEKISEAGDASNIEKLATALRVLDSAAKGIDFKSVVDDAETFHDALEILSESIDGVDKSAGKADVDPLGGQFRGIAKSAGEATEKLSGLKDLLEKIDDVIEKSAKNVKGLGDRLGKLEIGKTPEKPPSKGTKQSAYESKKQTPSKPSVERAAAKQTSAPTPPKAPASKPAASTAKPAASTAPGAKPSTSAKPVQNAVFVDAAPFNAALSKLSDEIERASSKLSSAKFEIPDFSPSIFAGMDSYNKAILTLAAQLEEASLKTSPISINLDPLNASISNFASQVNDASTRISGVKFDFPNFESAMIGKIEIKGLESLSKDMGVLREHATRAGSLYTHDTHVVGAINNFRQSIKDVVKNQADRLIALQNAVSPPSPPPPAPSPTPAASLMNGLKPFIDKEIHDMKSATKTNPAADMSVGYIVKNMEDIAESVKSGKSPVSGAEIITQLQDMNDLLRNLSSGHIDEATAKSGALGILDEMKESFVESSNVVIKEMADALVEADKKTGGAFKSELNELTDSVLKISEIMSSSAALPGANPDHVFKIEELIKQIKSIEGDDKTKDDVEAFNKTALKLGSEIYNLSNAMAGTAKKFEASKVIAKAPTERKFKLNEMDLTKTTSHQEAIRKLFERHSDMVDKWFKDIAETLEGGGSSGRGGGGGTKGESDEHFRAGAANKSHSGGFGGRDMFFELEAKMRGAKSLVDTINEASREMSKFNIATQTASNSGIFGDDASIQKLTSIRKNIGLTKREYQSFLSVASDGVKSGVTSLEKMEQAAIKLQNAYGGIQTERLKELVTLMKDIPSIEKDMSITATLDDKAAAYMLAAQQGKLDSVIEMQNAGVFGGLSKMGGKDQELLNSFRSVEKTMENVRDGILNIVPDAVMQFAPTASAILSQTFILKKAWGLITRLYGGQKLNMQQIFSSGKGIELAIKTRGASSGLGNGGRLANMPREQVAQLARQRQLGRVMQSGNVGGVRGWFKTAALSTRAGGVGTLRAGMGGGRAVASGLAMRSAVGVGKLATGLKALTGPMGLAAMAATYAGGKVAGFGDTMIKEGKKVSGGATKVVGGLLSVVGSAAALGTMFGPIGTAVGAAVGLFIGGAEVLSDGFDHLASGLIDVIESGEDYSGFTKVLAGVALTVVVPFKLLANAAAWTVDKITDLGGSLFAWATLSEKAYADYEAKKASAKEAKRLDEETGKMLTVFKKITSNRNSAFVRENEMMQKSARSYQIHRAQIENIEKSASVKITEQNIEASKQLLQNFSAVGGSAEDFNQTIGDMSSLSKKRFGELSDAFAKQRGRILADGKLESNMRQQILIELRQKEIAAVKRFVDEMQQTVNAFKQSSQYVKEGLKIDLSNAVMSLGQSMGGMSSQSVFGEIDKQFEARMGQLNQTLENEVKAREAAAAISGENAQAYEAEREAVKDSVKKMGLEDKYIKKDAQGKEEFDVEAGARDAKTHQSNLNEIDKKMKPYIDSLSGFGDTLTKEELDDHDLWTLVSGIKNTIESKGEKGNVEGLLKEITQMSNQYRGSNNAEERALAEGFDAMIANIKLLVDEKGEIDPDRLMDHIEEIKKDDNKTQEEKQAHIRALQTLARTIAVSQSGGQRGQYLRLEVERNKTAKLLELAKNVAKGPMDASAAVSKILNDQMMDSANAMKNVMDLAQSAAKAWESVLTLQLAVAKEELAKSKLDNDYTGNIDTFAIWQDAQKKTMDLQLAGINESQAELKKIHEGGLDAYLKNAKGSGTADADELERLFGQTNKTQVDAFRKAAQERSGAGNNEDIARSTEEMIKAARDIMNSEAFAKAGEDEKAILSKMIAKQDTTRMVATDGAAGLEAISTGLSTKKEQIIGKALEMASKSAESLAEYLRKGVEYQQSQLAQMRAQSKLNRVETSGSNAQVFAAQKENIGALYAGLKAEKAVLTEMESLDKDGLADYVRNKAKKEGKTDDEADAMAEIARINPTKAIIEQINKITEKTKEIKSSVNAVFDRQKEILSIEEERINNQRDYLESIGGSWEKIASLNASLVATEYRKYQIEQDRFKAMQEAVDEEGNQKYSQLEIDKQRAAVEKSMYDYQKKAFSAQKAVYDRQKEILSIEEERINNQRDYLETIGGSWEKMVSLNDALVSAAYRKYQAEQSRFEVMQKAVDEEGKQKYDQLEIDKQRSNVEKAMYDHQKKAFSAQKAVYDRQKEMLSVEEERINNQRDYLESIGGSWEKIVSLNAALVSTEYRKYQIEQDRFEAMQKAVDEEGKQKHSQLEIDKQRANAEKAMYDYQKRAMGAQKDAYEKLLGYSFGAIRAQRGARRQVNSEWRFAGAGRKVRTPDGLLLKGKPKTNEEHTLAAANAIRDGSSEIVTANKDLQRQLLNVADRNGDLINALNRNTDAVTGQEGTSNLQDAIDKNTNAVTGQGGISNLQNAIDGSSLGDLAAAGLKSGSIYTHDASLEKLLTEIKSILDNRLEEGGTASIVEGLNALEASNASAGAVAGNAVSGAGNMVKTESAPPEPETVEKEIPAKTETILPEPKKEPRSIPTQVLTSSAKQQPNLTTGDYLGLGRGAASTAITVAKSETTRSIGRGAVSLGRKGAANLGRGAVSFGREAASFGREVASFGRREVASFGRGTASLGRRGAASLVRGTANLTEKTATITTKAIKAILENPRARSAAIRAVDMTNAIANNETAKRVVDAAVKRANAAKEIIKTGGKRVIDATARGANTANTVKEIVKTGGKRVIDATARGANAAKEVIKTGGKRVVDATVRTANNPGVRSALKTAGKTLGTVAGVGSAIYDGLESAKEGDKAGMIYNGVRTSLYLNPATAGIAAVADTAVGGWKLGRSLQDRALGAGNWDEEEEKDIRIMERVAGGDRKKLLEMLHNRQNSLFKKENKTGREAFGVTFRRETKEYERKNDTVTRAINLLEDEMRADAKDKAFQKRIANIERETPTGFEMTPEYIEKRNEEAISAAKGGIEDKVNIGMTHDNYGSSNIMKSVDYSVVLDMIRKAQENAEKNETTVSDEIFKISENLNGELKFGQANQYGVAAAVAKLDREFENALAEKENSQKTMNDLNAKNRKKNPKDWTQDDKDKFRLAAERKRSAQQKMDQLVKQRNETEAVNGNAELGNKQDFQALQIALRNAGERAKIKERDLSQAQIDAQDQIDSFDGQVQAFQAVDGFVEQTQSAASAVTDAVGDASTRFSGWMGYAISAQTKAMAEQGTSLLSGLSGLFTGKPNAPSVPKTDAEKHLERLQANPPDHNPVKEVSGPAPEAKAEENARGAISEETLSRIEMHKKVAEARERVGKIQVVGNVAGGRAQSNLEALIRERDGKGPLSEQEIAKSNAEKDLARAEAELEKYEEKKAGGSLVGEKFMEKKRLAVEKAKARLAEVNKLEPPISQEAAKSNAEKDLAKAEAELKAYENKKENGGVVSKEAMERKQLAVEEAKARLEEINRQEALAAVPQAAPPEEISGQEPPATVPQAAPPEGTTGQETPAVAPQAAPPAAAQPAPEVAPPALKAPTAPPEGQAPTLVVNPTPAVPPQTGTGQPTEEQPPTLTNFAKNVASDLTEESFNAAKAAEPPSVQAPRAPGETPPVYASPDAMGAAGMASPAFTYAPAHTFNVVVEMDGQIFEAKLKGVQEAMLGEAARQVWRKVGELGYAAHHNFAPGVTHQNKLRF